ncbi:hypothetical protein GUJ93_ZPchr0003g16496 [Zizania palustris]|uniref:Glycosyltransferase n=1 Tax=Zizania palustris TaxID=103762 RepID=A0A8J5SAW8_ZIZPA|nr:hypothetical protein GUJ93_ZPchr0003g16496 [Zizania palustris]
MDASDSSAAAMMHVVVCPWLAFGHMIPFLNFAERLASRGHRVSFVSTPHNIARLPPVRLELAPLIAFVALPLPRVDGLPYGAESTNDIPYDKFELHRKAFDGLGEAFSEFLGAACADWVFVDAFHHWAAAAAFEHKVSCAMVLMCSAQSIASVVDWRPEGAESPPAAGHGHLAMMPTFEKERRMRMDTICSSGMSVVERFIMTVTRCSLVVLRSCAEFEPDTVPFISALRGKPLAFLGLMPPSPNGDRRGVSKKDGEDVTVGWLDAQPAKSVVYVALGTEVPLSVEQVHELALGLELAGTHFLWALRKPRGVSDADLLPPGFEERTHSRGLVTTGWVPQMSILAHAAVGSFLTHSGWGSIIEGLLFGHPLIMLPVYADQGPNTRLMERRKVGVQVPRNDGDGTFHREDVAAVVRAVAVEEESRREFQANAKKMQEIIADRDCHERYIDGFIQLLRSYTD